MNEKKNSMNLNFVKLYFNCLVGFIPFLILIELVVYLGNDNVLRDDFLPSILVIPLLILAIVGFTFALNILGDKIINKLKKGSVE